MQPGFIAIDRDGTIIENKNYLSDPAGVEFITGAIAGMLALQRIGLPTVIITNQSGIGRKYFTVANMEAVHRRMEAELALHGVAPCPIYHCPHTPEMTCECRKPATGMLEAVSREFNLPIESAVVIGDNQCDMELAEAAGCTGILVRSGYGRGLEEAGYDKGTIVVEGLPEAAAFISEML